MNPGYVNTILLSSATQALIMSLQKQALSCFLVGSKKLTQTFSWAFNNINKNWKCIFDLFDLKTVHSSIHSKKMIRLYTKLHGC